MNTQNNTPAPVIVPGLDWLFQWLDRHPRAADVLIWISTAAALYAALYHNFTTAF